MKALIKIYTASCLVVAGFFLFFLLPWGLMPFSDGVNLVCIGGLLIISAAGYTLYFYRREGFDLGWFLAQRAGFWVLTVAALGAVTLVCGTLIYAAPHLFVPAFEQGAFPFGVVIVSLFWMALIYMFAYLAFGMVARVVAYCRVSRVWDALINALIALFCLALAAVFFSLYLEVIHDILIRISERSQWNAIWAFAGLLTLAGAVYGFWNDPTLLIDKDAADDEAVRE